MQNARSSVESQAFDSAYAMNRFSLIFADREVETAFQWSWLRATQQMRMLWASAGTVLYATYSSLIWYVSSVSFLDLHWFRFLAVLPIFFLVTGLVYLRKTTPPIFDLVFPLVTTLAFANAAYCFATVPGQDNLLFLYEMAALFVCAMMYFPGLFKPISRFIVIGTAISFVAFWKVWLDAGQGWPAIAVQSSLLLALTFSGFAAAWSKEVLIRRNYRSRHLERVNRIQAERLARAANVASEAKSRFVAMVGHEFRTPLNAILGYTEILHRQEEAQWSWTRTVDYMGGVLQSARHLHRLVENVLSVSSDPDQPLEASLEVVELNSLVSRIAGAVLVKADARGIELNQSYGADRTDVLADSWMAAHMLDELLSNALKFTPPGGRIDVEVMPRKDGGGELRVSDNGAGIEADVQKIVFEPFTQSETDLNRTHDGLGLGLALVAKMAAAQSARVKLTSRVGEGTSILIIFRAQ